MGFSRVASLHLVPLLARLALCLVFVPIGWNRIMTIQTWTGDQAAAVRLMVEGPGETGSETPGTGTSTPPTGDAVEPISARGVYEVAVLFQANDVPRPLVSAWIISVVELVGGGFILLGLLTRIWALGLAFAMGLAFALTTWPSVVEVGPFGLDLIQFNRAAAQIGAGTLALGVLLSGPGAIAIDHGIFGSSRGRRHDESRHEEEEA